MDLFGGAAPRPDAAQVAKVKEWVRERFQLSQDAVVMVTELRCSEPGCPPLETVIAILSGPGSTRQHKMHQGVAEITREDIHSIAI